MEVTNQKTAVIDSIMALGLEVSDLRGLLFFTYRDCNFDAALLGGVLHLSTVLNFSDDLVRQMEVCAMIRNCTVLEANPGPREALLTVAVPLPEPLEEVRGMIRDLITVQINGALDIYEEMIVVPERRQRIIRTRNILKGFLRAKGLDRRSIRHVLRPDSQSFFADRDIAAQLSKHMASEYGMRIHPDNISEPIMMGRLVKELSRFLP